MQKAIAIFDIGKTNKKFLLFDDRLNVVFQNEEKFPATIDDDGDECDDIDRIEKWILQSLRDLIREGKYDIKGVNFSTYGASLAFLDKEGKRLTPVYDYLKNIPADISEELYGRYGGRQEFCRRTASPALGAMLNSGMQVLWLKREKPAIFEKTAHVLHFPQYLAYMFSNRILSECTSVGCHTALWDFDNMDYHPWLKDEEIELPRPVPNSTASETCIEESQLKAGPGIHDSSASLVPYMYSASEKFILVSTGTWCISMNPYNYEPLTSEELEQDCLCYLSTDQKPVKSSRLFLGHIHDVNVRRLCKYFGVPGDAYKSIKPDASIIKEYFSDSGKVFFSTGMTDDYIDRETDPGQFEDFSKAYHRLMFDLTLLNTEKINLVLPENDNIKRLYVSGGFARNEIYVRLLAGFYPDKEVYTSEIDNSSALGAALAIWDVMEQKTPGVDLGLKKWNAF